VWAKSELFETSKDANERHHTGLPAPPLEGWIGAFLKSIFKTPNPYRPRLMGVFYLEVLE